MSARNSPAMADDGKDALQTELKYVVPASRTAMAISLLGRLCNPDPDFPAGVVSSIYYDTRDWAYLLEKRNSDYLKTKVRLRWYEQVESDTPPADHAFAEVKCRIGSMRIKKRLRVDYSGAELAAMDLEDRRLLEIPPALIAAGAPILHTVAPAFVVRYHRRRYIDRSTHARVSIDFGITAPKVNKQMLANAFPCALEYTVLEVKGTKGRLPLGLHSMLKLGFRHEAFSKYFECFRLLTRTEF